MYQLLPDGIIQHNDGTSFYPDADHDFASEYLEWVAKGNTPTKAPKPTAKQLWETEMQRSDVLMSRAIESIIDKIGPENLDPVLVEKYQTKKMLRSKRPQE